MKSTPNSKLRRLLGIAPEHGPHRIARLPFILSHIVAYALAFLLFQIIGYILVRTGNQTYEMGDFAFSIFLLAVSVVLVPIHIRRAHDLAWSAKTVFWFSIMPSFLRLVCFVIPLTFFALAPGSLPTLMKIMPYIGLLYWFLNQVQMAFMVVLAFAPGTGTHNRFGDMVAKSFTMKNLYGFQMLKGRVSKADVVKSE
jgi:uncharacterized membrane protein YhaH (DUF805 family)